MLRVVATWERYAVYFASVSLMAAPNGSTVGVAGFALVNGSAVGTTPLLPGGTYNVTAHYPGDGSFAASDSAPVQVTVGKENSQTTAEAIRQAPANQENHEGTNSPCASIS